MSSLHIAVLGQPEVRKDDSLLSFATRKAMALMAYLVIEGGMHSRTYLSEFFWPDSDAQHGHMSLRGILKDLRNVLGDSSTSISARPSLFVDRMTVGIDPTAELDVDLYRFQVGWSLAISLAQSSLAIESSSHIRTNALAQLQQAARLYRGDLLAGFTLPDAPDFDVWARYQREQWHLRMHQVFEQLSILYELAGQEESALETILSWVVLDPLYEKSTLRLMRVYASVGHRVAALRTYEDYRTRLWDEQQAEPTMEMIALAEAVRTTPQPKKITISPVVNSSLYAAPVSSPTRIEGPLRGRTQEFNWLIESFRHATRGRSQVVLIEGEAGIGKTRLVTEWLNWVATQGATVLAGRAYKTGGQLPYQPIIELLRRRMEEENAPDDLLTDIWLTEVSRLLPELRERYPDLAVPTGDISLAQTHLFEAIARLLHAWAQRTPLVLFMDDIQWVDTSSLDLLHYLARFWMQQGTPVCLVLTQRTDEIRLFSERLDWYQELERLLPLSRFSLSALSQDDTLHFLYELMQYQRDDDRPIEDAISCKIGVPLTREGILERLGHWLFDYTGGQPFYVLETLNALVDLGVLKRSFNEKGAWQIDITDICQHAERIRQIVPSSVRMLLDSRIRNLSTGGKELLASAAVLGQETTFEHLCQVGELNDKEGLASLDEVVRNGLLREPLRRVQPKSTYSFPHEITRQVVYSGIGEARKRLLHKRVFHLLKQERSSAASLAYHAMEAGYIQQAFCYSIVAGNEALAIFAIQDALGYFEQARKLLIAHSEDRDLNEVLNPLKIQELYTHLGYGYQLRCAWGQAQQAYEEMLAYARKHHELVSECAALNCLAVLATQHPFEPRSVKQLLLQALQIAKKANDRIGQAETAWNLAQLSGYSRDLSLAFISGEQVFDAARKVGRPDFVVRNIGGIVNTNARLNVWEQNVVCVNADEAAEYAEEAAALYAQLGNRVMEADCLCMVAEARIHAGRAFEAIDLLQQAYLISIEQEDLWGQALSTCRLSWALQEQGLYEEALDSCHKAITIARGLEILPLLFACLAIRGAIDLCLLRLDNAAADFLEAEAINQKFPNQPYKEFVARKLCAVYVLKGDLASAYNYAQQALKQKDQSTSVINLTRWFETSALLQHGEEQLARADVVFFGHWIANNRRYRISYLRSLAMLAQYDGNLELAIVHLREAVTLATELDLPGEVWPIYKRLYELYEIIDERDLAEQAFHTAIAVLQELVDRIHDPQLQMEFLSNLHETLWQRTENEGAFPIDQV